MKRIFLIILTLLLMLVGCSKEPQPEERFAQYIKLWNEKKFDKMYDFLSKDAKELVTKKEFTSRHEKIYEDLEISDLKMSFKKPKEERDEKAEEMEYQFSAKMNSLAGEIAFDQMALLTREERDDKANWYIEWSPTFIFPELEKGAKLGVDTIEAERGSIVDRHDNPIAFNGLAYEVGVIPEKMTDADKAKLSSLLKLSQEQIDKALTASWVKPNYFVPLKKISLDDKELIAKLIELVPVQTKKVEARTYPLGEVAAHLIGYVGPVTADDLEKLKGKGYTSNDVVGKRGLEQVFEEQLKGTDGSKITITKVGGREVTLAEKSVEHGKTVKLTIDVETQQKVFAELKGEAGTAAVIDPVTGETLALASSPSFNPNKMVIGLSKDEWKVLEDDKKQPLMTRFKQTFAPGSVMKPITAAIALKNNTLTANQELSITGLKWQKDKSWGKYNVTRVHESSGPVDLEEALVASDNIYFAQAALLIGKDKFAAGLKEFAFEQELKYPFPLEASKIGGLDTDILLADSGYGQGQIEMSIVHLLATYTPLVNQGKMVMPTLLFEEPKSQVLKEGVMTPESVTAISSSLRKVVSDANGTAHAAEIPGYPLTGKTGTAELKLKQGEKGTENGWFVAYGTEQPTHMIAMMIEDVGKRKGSQVPVKKVKKLFEHLKQ